MGFSVSIAGIATILFPASMIYAGIADILTYKIRNILVVGVALGYVLLAPLAGIGATEIALNLALGLTVFAVTFGFFAAGWIGGGDAKLATAAALWFGWEHALPYFLYAALIGGALSVGLLLFRQFPLPAFFYRAEWVIRLHTPGSGVPYGAAFALAALIVFPETGWYAAAANG